jgi:hypothetical protein
VKYEDKDHQEEDQPLVCELRGDDLNGIKGSDTHSRSNNCLFVDFIVVVISMNLITHLYIPCSLPVLWHMPVVDLHRNWG